MVEINSYVDYAGTQWQVLAHHLIGKSLNMYWLKCVYNNKFATVREEDLTMSRLWERPKTDAGTSRAVKNYDGR